MINKLNKKLRSNTGSSLILVLMLFFMCVMVSSVVVAVAGSGAGRIAKRETQQQGYLSVLSAVELAIEEMKDCGKVVGIDTTIDFGCNDLGRKYYSPAYIEETRTDASQEGATEGYGYHTGDVTANRAAANAVDIWQVDGENLEGIFAGLLGKACIAVYDNGEETYTNQFTIESGDGRLTKVYCDFTMYSDYTITMTFTGENTNYTMTVIFPCTPVTTEGQTPYTCKHVVMGKKEVNGAVNEFAEPIEREFEGVEKTVNTQITWGTPTIIKGVE